MGAKCCRAKTKTKPTAVEQGRHGRHGSRGSPKTPRSRYASRPSTDYYHGQNIVFPRGRSRDKNLARRVSRSGDTLRLGMGSSTYCTTCTESTLCICGKQHRGTQSAATDGSGAGGGATDRDVAKSERYPKAVAYIISNEFCERFNYYGMRTILVLYLTSKLHYDKDTSTVLFHVFTMLVYLFPIVGAIIADSWLGKYKTILYLSLVYALGGVIIALGAVPTLEWPVKEATIIGLILIAIGTGGIKPCVSAFGGDQFRMPEQCRQLATFFSLFYFAINAGSMISTTITPILRADMHCFGDKDCFSLAFGVPAILMLISVVIFVAGKKLYIMKPPAGNMIFGVSKCVADAISGWRMERKTNPRAHFLDYAEPRSGVKMVADTKTLFKILVLYLPFPIFWALFDQQGSRWTFQATRMDGELMGYTIKPDQMQVVNPLLILGFIPLFDYVLYPILSKIGIRRPLQKLTLGGLLAAGAFMLSAFVELKLQAETSGPPDMNGAHLRIYNAMPCTYSFSSDLQFYKPAIVEPLGMFEDKSLLVTQELAYDFRAHSTSDKCPNMFGTFHLVPGVAVGYLLTDNNVIQEFEDSTEKSKLGNPVVRMMVNVPDIAGVLTLIDPSQESTSIFPSNASQVINVERGMSFLTINGKTIGGIETKMGGVYAYLVYGSEVDGIQTNMVTVTEPNSVHMIWQLPQIIVITAAEIMFSVTGLEFSFTQAPQTMKSVLQACWLLSVAIGNMLVVAIAEMKFFDSQASEFMLFAALMVVDMFIFMLIAMRYTYVDQGFIDTECCQESPTKRESVVKITEPRSSATRDGHSNEAFTVE